MRKIEVMTPEQVDEALSIERNAIGKEPIFLAVDSEIIAMLDEGIDSYRICQLLECTALDVVNAERKRHSMRRLFSKDPTPIIDEQVTDPEKRLLLFPPVPEGWEPVGDDD